MDTKVKAALLVAAVASIAIGVKTVLAPRATPQDRIDIDTGCVQAAATGAATAYTGNYALWVWQWGFIAIDTVAGTHQHPNGVGKNFAPFCPPALAIAGDCWQSVSELAASKDTPKWVVAAGAPEMCKISGGPFDGLYAQGLAVWKVAGSSIIWQGLILSNVRRVGAMPQINGDKAYALRTMSGPDRWIEYDLNTLAVVREDLVTPPAADRQGDLQGYTYQLYPDDPTPTPPGYPGPHKFHALREGGPPPPPPTVTTVPTIAPPPAPTPGGYNALAPWIEQLAAEGISAGCGPGIFCPKANLTREQAAVWLLKKMHGADYVPPPCVGRFSDVPCAPHAPVLARPVVRLTTPVALQQAARLP